jgi:hemerythrin-like metal-binding protein
MSLRLKYTVGFKTGDRKLDIELRVLIGLFHDCFALYRDGADDEDIADLQRTLVRYFQHHIEHQNGLMEIHRYPARSTHRLHHQRFQLELKQALRTDDTGGGRFAALREFYRSFFTVHIQTLDKDFYHFMRVRRPSDADGPAAPPCPGPRP